MAAPAGRMLWLLLLLVGFLCYEVEGVTYTKYGKLPKFLTNNPLPNGYPWGKATATNTNPETGFPNTGVKRSYHFTISRQQLAPDGVTKSGILINNQFPGPLIEANWGDTIEVTVVNNIQDEGTTVHWHGQTQRLNPGQDGVPAVSQCPIPPGGTITYTFRAEVYGTSWYHSHYSAQYQDGIFGPMIVYGPRSASYDEDLGPVLLSEYFRQPYYEVTSDSLKSPPVFLNSSNNFINGRMDTNCIEGSKQTAPCDVSKLTQFNFSPGKTYLLRLINPGIGATQKFSIDGHKLTIIANDYVAVKPYQVDTVTLGVGQRADVLVKATGKAGDLTWMRSDLDDFCSGNVTGQVHTLGVVTYSSGPAKAAPKTKATPWQSNNCLGDPLTKTVPEYPIAPPPKVATTRELDITGQVNGSGILLWNVNNQTFRGNYNYPVFLLAKTGNTSFPNDPEWNVYNFGTNSSIRIVLYNYFPLPHPMHLHGHNMWVIDEGSGQYSGRVVNPSNPQRRDVHIMAPGTPDVPSYLVLQWNADNPGVWPLHCHLIGHTSLGLYINVVERPDLIPKRPVPSNAADNCRAWWTFTKHSYVDQIDSGL